MQYWKYLLSEFFPIIIGLSLYIVSGLVKLNRHLPSCINTVEESAQWIQQPSECCPKTLSDLTLRLLREFYYSRLLADEHSIHLPLITGAILSSKRTDSLKINTVGQFYNVNLKMKFSVAQQFSLRNIPKNKLSKIYSRV